MSKGLITRQELSQDLNEELNKTGVLSNLVTSAKTTLVHAINETYNRTTTLFNQIGTQIGTLSSLATSSKTNLVSAINETYNRTTTLFDQLSTRIGALSSLTTTNKTNLVSAVNEVNGKITNTQIRLNNGKIEYYDGRVWKGVDEAMIQPTKPRQGFIDLREEEFVAGAYYTVVDVTGKGILSDIVFSSITVNNEYMYIRITVDGASHEIHPDKIVTATGAPLTSVSGSSTSSDGGSYRALKWSGLMYFNNSLKVEFRCTSKKQYSKISGVVSYALV